MASIGSRTLLVTSSGFLTPDNPPEVLRANLDLVGRGHSLCLLPSDDPDLAAPIVVARQMARGFGLDPVREDRTFRERLGVYRALGDRLVVSLVALAAVAAAVAAELAGDHWNGG